jgi:hypothetical protein
MARLVVLFAVVEFRFMATANAFASVVKVAKAATHASANVAKVEGADLSGAGGKAVIVIFISPL